MKTLISKLVVIVAFVCATNVNAQNPNQFDAQLETTLRNINSDDAASVSKGMDELKRIASQYPDAWLPTYYQALSALQYAVRFPNDNHSSSFLVNVNNITSAKGNSNGYQLRLSNCRDIIPVSRTFVPELRAFVG